MKKTKLILLGSAAGLGLAVTAQAADLPSRKAAPVDYVRICSAYGAGFFFIPGTDTCLRVGGYVRAEYQYTPGRDFFQAGSPAFTPAVNAALAARGFRSQVGADQDTMGMEFRGRVDLDARTQTAWGTAQTVVILRGTNTDGIRTIPGTVTNAPGRVPPVNGTTGITMERAFIRFAGFTFGVSSENFVAYPSLWYHSSMAAGFPNGIKQLAYTATFGGGFSATIAAESKYDFGGSNGVTNYTYVKDIDTGFVLVGNLRVDQAWGFAQLSGAVTQNSLAAVGAPVLSANGVLGAPANNLLSGDTTMTAWAIGFHAKINLPMIARGDAFYFTARYGEGLNGLVGCSVVNSCSDAANRRINGGVQYVVPNAILTSTVGGNRYEQTRSWFVGGAFTHYWAPQWRSNFNVGYNQILVPTANATAGLQLGNASVWGAAANLIWSPVSRLDIGVELAYLQHTLRVQNATAAYVAAGSPGTGTRDNWSAKFRVQRAF